MKNKIWTILIVSLVALAVVLYFIPPKKAEAPLFPPSPVDNTPPPSEPDYSDLIRITVPKPNDLVTSPVRVAGEARGNWYFEASFPARMMDANGNAVALTPSYIQTSSEWMTTDFVPFDQALTFKAPNTDTGFLILQKDNPSGSPENAASIKIPVRFR